jgi:UDP-N-acetylmuramate: L-alanyl-gamma-D-glutamyl-meso-diaminopimelate ligase
MKHHQKEVDYMVGALIEGFDTMVHLTHDNEFIVLEGDEYLTSALDLRPKFHLYKPHIALISGIAWDHINVFPTFENYVKQFDIFIDQIEIGGCLVYNETDENVKYLAEKTQKPTKKYAYNTLPHLLKNGKTYLWNEEGEIPLQVFGKHNVQNMAGAMRVCQIMGVDEKGFMEAIGSFVGAGKRLEKLVETESAVLFKDFAHSPSKVKATVEAVKSQFPDRKLVACFELHTYSSLNPVFLKDYEGTLNPADVAIVFYSPHAVSIKGLAEISVEQIKKSFNRDDLQVFTNPLEFRDYLFNQDLTHVSLLLMSSGDYGGIDFETLKSNIYGKTT